MTSDDAALALAKRELGYSKLPYVMEGLTEIPQIAGKALGPKLDGRLFALKDLSVELAEGLGTKRGDVLVRSHLRLNVLKEISPAAAKAISTWEGDIYLDGLAEISDESLKALAEYKPPPNLRATVYLRGLKTISDPGAAILSNWPRWCGDVPSLTGLTEVSAARLASSGNWSGNLRALRSLTPSVAKELVNRPGNLLLDGLTALSRETVTELAKHHAGTLSLNGLSAVSDDAASILAEHQGRLSLNGVQSLSHHAASSLGRHRGDWLLLDGLGSVTDDVARSLAGHSGIVSLKGLRQVSAKSLEALKSNPRIAFSDTLRATPAVPPVKADGETVGAFLKVHCFNCHSGDSIEGDFSMNGIAFDSVGGRVAYASILERLRAGDMPPNVEDRPDPAISAGVIQWVSSQLDKPLPGPVTAYAVKEKPVDGNRLPHAILFGGPRGPSVPPPPRLWRLSPAAYAKSLGPTNSSNLQQPFGLIHEAGFKDFSAIYASDEGATSLLLTNADLVVSAQLKQHSLVNINELPSNKDALWPSEERIRSASPAERQQLASGERVRQGNGIYAPLAHPAVSANREELVKAINQQFQIIVQRVASNDELESLLALYRDVARDGDYLLAGKTILMAPLMTPEAILRFEIGLGAEVRPGVRMLSPREAAFAISLSLSTKRDLELLSVATAGKLSTRDDVAVAVGEVFKNPKLGKSRVLTFFREFFDYYRAPDIFKDPLPDNFGRHGIRHLPDEYVAETDLFILRILAEDQDVLTKLLTAPTALTPDAARILWSAVRGFPGGAFQDNGSSPILRHQPPSANETSSPPANGNIGILMHPSWHVAWSTSFHNDIVRRGRWVRERLLGGRVPDLPIDVQALVPDDPHRTLRQRQSVTRAAECWKCHYRMDDLGTPFEHADHYGFLRVSEPVLDLAATSSAKDNKTKLYRVAPLDTTGFIHNSGDAGLDGPVADAPEMLRRLAGSERVRQVFIRHAFRFFLGRNETPGDAVTLQEADSAYVDSGGSFRALLISLLSSESFLYRTIPVIAHVKDNP